MNILYKNTPFSQKKASFFAIARRFNKNLIQGMIRQKKLMIRRPSPGIKHGPSIGIYFTAISANWALASAAAISVELFHKKF
ncbi:hypothetical protein LJC59_02575 [Desulfovibrio sp. OttesenSCG-928-A18]|nr:hypothetical protein [Desulfovibrio sp. OttesenSCG-928-A18]